MSALEAATHRTLPVLFAPEHVTDREFYAYILMVALIGLLLIERIHRYAG